MSVDLRKSVCVWGKMPGFRWWPAIIIDGKDCGRNDTKEKSWIFWFGDHKVSQMPKERLKDFKKEYKKHFIYKGKRFINAVEETLTVLSEACSSKPCNLFEWAANGFIIQGHFLPEKVKGLPKIVSDYLSREEFQRKSLDSDEDSNEGSEDNDEEDESADKIENLLPDVLKGVKRLEDLCISCCKPSALVVKKHPFFLGGVCGVCKKNVEYTCRIPFGVSQDYCIVCGQGGTLIICSNSLCLRSFCNLCIKYMTPKDTFKKILSSATWNCYLCESDSRNRCIIIPRTQITSQQNSLIPVSKNKSSVNVFSHSGKIISILKSKRSLIGNYATVHLESGKPAYSKELIDKEFKKLSANFVCGSYLEDPIMLPFSNKDVKLFLAEFYSFLYSLNNAKLVSEKVFFAFLLNAELNNYLVQERLFHYLEVPPVVVKTNRKKLYIWTNIPNCSSLNQAFKKQNFADFISEDHFFTPVIELLSKYFKHGK